MERFEYYLSWINKWLLLRACRDCQRLVSEFYLWCPSCAEKKFTDQKIHHNSREVLLSKESGIKFIHRFSVLWHPDSASTQSEISAELGTGILTLKEKGSAADWALIARLFVKQHPNLQMTVSPPLYFVPIPSSRKRRHSEHFARALSKIYNGNFLPILEASSREEQKRKNLKERKAIKFLLNPSIAENARGTSLMRAILGRHKPGFQDLQKDSGKHTHSEAGPKAGFRSTGPTLVLVDDILTSGASARAALKALEPLRNCYWAGGKPEVWTVAFRPRVNPSAS